MSNESSVNKRMAEPGWGKSPASKKWHYFHDRENGTSLCGRIGFYFGPTEQGNDTSVDNCAKCQKELRELRRS